MSGRIIRLAVAVVFTSLPAAMAPQPATAAEPGPKVKAILDQLDSPRGICVIVDDRDAKLAIELAKASELLVYVQLPNAEAVQSARRAVEKTGLLNVRVFVEQGTNDRIHLADNLADIVAAAGADVKVSKEESLRVLRPGGKAFLGEKTIVKPVPKGMDTWSHPYHGPDNNPQSTDRLARAPYLTQFLAEPLFVPMPEVSVAADGRVYRAFGHIAHKANQNPMLNTLLCINAYNGTILWRRPLHEGFMIHRNTMIATPEVFYLGDNESCKMIDPQTGKIQDEIVISKDISDGPVWKWMALPDGVLYALVGGEEVYPHTQRSNTPGMGHWPWGMWEGHDYKNPKTNFGFGRTFVAIDPKTKKTLWRHREDEYMDSRGVCMCAGRIFFYSPEKLLGCLDAKTGKVLWKTSNDDLLKAIGPNGRAQHYVTGYSTTTYIKCNDKYIFFAGPQRARMVVASAKDGKLLWQRDGGNLQLVLRDDAIYAAGPGQTGVILDYATGKELGKLPTRRACTRATGSVDSVFYRASGGTVRINTGTKTAQHIAPMRPPCHDGVIISDGLLFWGPWMCGCQLSLYGHICAGPAGKFFEHSAEDDDRLQQGNGGTASVERFEIKPDDWPAYCGNNGRTCATNVAIPREVTKQWTFQVPTGAMPTAPVIAGGVTFLGDRGGTVWALGKVAGTRRVPSAEILWKANTGGPVYFPPAVAGGRVFAGSADGRVYAFEAATGRLLWSYRVAPVDRRIPAYGKLISTWPVAGGVVVEDGTVYAAAGITHYDGTHVVALDAANGKPKWRNDSSGDLSKKVDCGISLQGDLYLADGELRFLGGNAYETARYDLKTGKCRNQPWDNLNSRFHTAFYPYYPVYGKYLSLDYTFPDRKSLIYDASYEGSRFSNLALFEPLPPGAQEPWKPASRWGRRNPPSKRKAVWQDNSGRRYTGFAASPHILLAAGHARSKPILAAIDIKDGSTVWQQELPATPVKGGVAVDHGGRIVVSLEGGQVLCFAKGV